MIFGWGGGSDCKEGSAHFGCSPFSVGVLILNISGNICAVVKWGISVVQVCVSGYNGGTLIGVSGIESGPDPGGFKGGISGSSHFGPGG